MRSYGTVQVYDKMKTIEVNHKPINILELKKGLPAYCSK
jgi:hypothetical protein